MILAVDEVALDAVAALGWLAVYLLFCVFGFFVTFGVMSVSIAAGFKFLDWLWDEMRRWR